MADDSTIPADCTKNQTIVIPDGWMDYYEPKWQAEIFPEYMVFTQKRPNIWARFWQRLFFGIKWIPYER